MLGPMSGTWEPTEVSFHHCLHHIMIGKKSTMALLKILVTAFLLDYPFKFAYMPDILRRQRYGVSTGQREDLCTTRVINGQKLGRFTGGTHIKPEFPKLRVPQL